METTDLPLVQGLSAEVYASGDVQKFTIDVTQMSDEQKAKFAGLGTLAEGKKEAMTSALGQFFLEQFIGKKNDIDCPILVYKLPDSDDDSGTRKSFYQRRSASDPNLPPETQVAYPYKVIFFTKDEAKLTGRNAVNGDD